MTLHMPCGHEDFTLEQIDYLDTTNTLIQERCLDCGHILATLTTSDHDSPQGGRSEEKCQPTKLVITRMARDEPARVR